MVPLFLLILTFSTLLSVSSQNVYYPDENGNVIYNNHVFHVSDPQISPTIFLKPHPSLPVPPKGTNEYERYVENAISTGLMKLTLAVKKVFTSQSMNEYDNVAFAPVSIAGSLALILLGANGRTYQEISTLLGFATGVPDLDKKPQTIHEQFGRMITKLEKTSGLSIWSQVNFATAVFIQENYPIRKLYKMTAENIYQSEILNLNFQQNPSMAQDIINAWVSDRTKGKITKILNEPPSVDTKVILASAMYFKAEWEFPFFEGATKRRLFYTHGKDKPSNVYVDMMSNGGDFPYWKDDVLNCEIIGFPYKGNQSTMYIVKPFNSTKSKLEILENSLTVEHLNRFISNVKTTSSIIIFPKMLIETTIDLSSPLKMLGISSLFDPAQANLALLSPGYLKNVSNKNFVINPLTPNIPKLEDSFLIFNRFGETVNCTNVSCEKVNGNSTKRTARSPIEDNLDGLRENINNNNSYENPGLYADKVIHKVYMHITETGTEAAATTAIGLSKHGSRNVFRAEVPFFFFIMHEETKIITFWGSVNKPTPFYTSK